MLMMEDDEACTYVVSLDCNDGYVDRKSVGRFLSDCLQM